MVDARGGQVLPELDCRHTHTRESAVRCVWCSWLLLLLLLLLATACLSSGVGPPWVYNRHRCLRIRQL